MIRDEIIKQAEDIRNTPIRTTSSAADANYERFLNLEAAYRYLKQMLEKASKSSDATILIV